MSTKKVKRKRAATPVAAVVEDAPAAFSQPTVALASSCNVKDAAELKQSLCHYVDECAPVALEVGRVERVDTSTMQLLCAFVRDRAAQQRKVDWVGDTRVIRDAARLLGVELMLALPPAEGST
jgi:ABC-type transporter Mla MlaB component